MHEPYKAAPDVYALPTHLPVPGVGNLLVNAFALLAEEPVLIDTGIGVEGPNFLAALESIIAPEKLRWVWLTHDDADHTGSIREVLQRAPQARLATHAFSARGWPLVAGPAGPRARAGPWSAPWRGGPHAPCGPPPAVRQPHVHRRLRRVQGDPVLRRLLRCPPSRGDPAPSSTSSPTRPPTPSRPRRSSMPSRGAASRGSC